MRTLANAPGKPRRGETKGFPHDLYASDKLRTFMYGGMRELINDGGRIGAR
jgi:hypothetical protein